MAALEPTVHIDYWQSGPHPAYPDETYADIYGFTACEMATGQMLGRSNLDWGPRKWKQRGVARLEVVGESFHRAALQHPGFNRGAPVLLRIEENEHGIDGQAVAVYEASGSAQAGHISNADLPVVMNLLRQEGPDVECIVWREVRRKDDGRRYSLEVLVHRRGALDIDPAPEPAPIRRRGLVSRIFRR